MSVIAWSPDGENPHLTADQREVVQHGYDEVRSARGRQVLRVVVDVFENEVVPQVQLPKDSPIAVGDQAAVGAAVARAAEVLGRWR